MKHTSIKLDTPCEFINVTPLNPLISKCQIKVCYVGEQPNRNGSIITKEVATEMGKTLPGSPIVGFFDTKKQDFDGHNKTIEITEDGEFQIVELTRPYGFVDINASVWFQKFLDDGIEHEYLMTEGFLWTGQYPEAQRALSGENGQSMELDEKSLQGTWVKSYNEESEFFIINEAIISKLCILGEDVEPCFEGASIIKTEFSFGDEFNQNLLMLIQAVKEFQKGGEYMSEQEKEVLEVQEEVIEENTPEVTFEEAAPEEEVSENISEEIEDEKVQYNLEEIPEYIELVEKYQNLVGQVENLQKEKELLENQVKELSAFKLTVDRKEKEKMIKEEFYMLSDKDKEDVVKNIDTYSLDEIEAKLSVICVRNKVSFNLDEDEGDNVITYSVNSENVEEDLVPDWIKAVQDTKKKNNL